MSNGTVRGLVDQDLDHELLAEQLPDAYELTVGVEGSPDVVSDALDGIDVVFCTSRVPLPRRVLSAASDLQLVAKIGVGLDNVDLDAAAEFGIGVTYTPGVPSQAVAEHAVALLLALNRHLVDSQTHLQAGGWRDDFPATLDQVSDDTIGIVGFGDIGRRTASLLSGFNVDILAADPYVRKEDTDIVDATLVPLEPLLERSNAVLLSCALTEETRGLISAAELDRMKSTAYLVNTSRGPVVDEDALIDALEADEIAGAGLDVFSSEPLSPSSPFHEMPNVITTPHIGGIAEETHQRAVELLAENTRKFFDGEEVASLYLAVET